MLEKEVQRPRRPRQHGNIHQQENRLEHKVNNFGGQGTTTTTAAAAANDLKLSQ